MKKLLLMLFVVLMALALVACSQDQENSDSSSSMMTAEEGEAVLIEQGKSGSKGIDHTGFRLQGTIVYNSVETYFDVGGENLIRR